MKTLIDCVKNILIQLILILILVSCTNAVSVDPTLVQQATLTPLPSSTVTIAPTATITPEPTPTNEPLPSRWDDPELIATIRSDFEKITGLTVEDYYLKAVEDGWMGAHSADQFFNTQPFVDSAQNGIVLGTGLIETNNGAYRHLVLYISRRTIENKVGIYPLDVAFEKGGAFTQTLMDTINHSDNPNLYMYIEPIIYTSLEEVARSLNEEIGNNISFDLLIRFRNLESCTLPQGRYIGNVTEVFWEYIGGLCLTPGNYINTASQEPTKRTADGNEYPQTYSLSRLMEQGVPDAGFIPLIIGIYTVE